MDDKKHNASVRASTFARAADTLLDSLAQDEDLILSYAGEDVDYLRFNGATFRQATRVDDGLLRMTLIKGQKQIVHERQLTNDAHEAAELRSVLANLRHSVATLPDDPYVVRPAPADSSHEAHRGQLCTGEAFFRDVLEPSAGLDLVGIHQSGTSYRGVAHSKGLRHWFETDGYATDYSLFHNNGKAVKGTFAGRDWLGTSACTRLLKQAAILERLGQEPMRLKPGKYDVYLEPAATADLIAMFSYDGVSAACLRQGTSALALLAEGKRKLSPKVSLTEDFSSGLVPRFNDFGELSPQRLPIVERGKFVNSLVSPRTAKEYGLASNGATSEEYLRSPQVAGGTLESAHAVTQLGTGIYIPNLHYLNWSDRQGARVTGMTRYACMWVENGNIVAPIVDMRFDESLYDCLGDKLEDCTKELELVPNTGSYEGRQLGGITVPGMLIRGFSFTL
jgi:predicted Zn-dependent protease